MITKHDELLCHQLVTTFDHVYTSDARWTERIGIWAFDISGDVSLLTGLARYTNRNVIDAYGMVTLNNETAHIVRTSSELRPETSGGLEVGPYSYEVIEPLKKVRATLGENEYGLSFQLDFEGTFPPYEQIPTFFRSRGRIVEDAVRYYQVGKLSGWFKVDGKTHEINTANWRIARDHSWGVRRGGGGGSWPEPLMQPSEIPQGVLYFLCIANFEKYMIHCAVREDWDGTPNHFEGYVIYPYGSEREALKLVSVEHDLEFHRDLRLIKSGRIVVNAVDGSKREISICPLTSFFPGPASYDMYNDYMSGMWKGPSYIDGFKLDISDPNVLKQISFLKETWCEVRCGDDSGYGHFESVFVGKYPKYGFEGY